MARAGSGSSPSATRSSRTASACIEEEQDLVFRSAARWRRAGRRRATTRPTPTWVEERVADPVLLFRFSAVTANAHRIHYDHPYATGVEGYPDLVVHGPLTAILLAELARAPGRPGLRSRVSYRARAPHFANRRFWLTGLPDRRRRRPRRGARRRRRSR